MVPGEEEYNVTVVESLKIEKAAVFVQRQQLALSHEAHYSLEKKKVHKTCRALPIITYFCTIYTSSYAMIYQRTYYPTKIKGLELKSEYENTILLPKD